MVKTLNTSPPDREKRGIQSIQIGFQIVRVIAESEEPLTLSLIARAVDMAPSKAVLYLNSFCAIGLVARDSALRYCLGPYALELGVLAMSRADIVAIARDEMRIVREAPVFAAYLSVWGSQGPVIVAKDDKHPQLPMTVRLGHVLPLLSSAAGLVYVTHLPQELTAAPIKAELKQSPISEDAIAALKEDVLRKGYASRRGHVNTGIIASAAPVFDCDGSLAGALTVLSPMADQELVDSNVTAPLLEAARKVSAALGYTTAVANN